MSLALLHNPSHITQQLLVDLGLGSNPLASPAQDWPIRYEKSVDTPDNIITVFDTTGRDSGRVQPTGELSGYDGIQVMVRGATKNAAYVKAAEIRKALAESVYNTHVTLDGVTYIVQSYVDIGRVIRVGEDAPNTTRHLYSVNSLVVVYRHS